MISKLPARLRLRKLESFARLRTAGCSEADALAQLQISWRTLYRWKAARADCAFFCPCPRPHAALDWKPPSEHPVRLEAA